MLYNKLKWMANILSIDETIKEPPIDHQEEVKIQNLYDEAGGGIEALADILKYLKRKIKSD